jgi:ABC-type amino acid transport substrate-binding protein
MRQLINFVSNAAGLRRCCLLGLLASVSVAFYFGVASWQLSREIHHRVFRIGVNDSPPFNVINRDGSFGGIAPEMLKEASRRSGIALEWVVVPGDVDNALGSGVVDLWPLLTDTPERRARFHLTDPWLENRLVLVVRKEDSLLLPLNFNENRIAVFKLALNQRLLRKFLPGAWIIPSNTAGAGMESLCRAEVRAVFMDHRNAMIQLLNRAPRMRKDGIRDHTSRGRKIWYGRRG